MEQKKEREEPGGSSLSEVQKSPASIPGPQTLALSQAGSGPVLGTGSVLPQLPEGLAAVTIPIRLDALSYLLHSALLGAYSLRPGPAHCPCHPGPCCTQPPASVHPVVQDPPKQHWVRRNQREPLWPGERGPRGGRGGEPTVNNSKQSWRARPLPIRPPIKDLGGEYQRQRPLGPPSQPKEYWDSKYHPRKAFATASKSLTEEWEKQNQQSFVPQPKEESKSKYHHQEAPATSRTPPSEDWESEYLAAPSSTTPEPQDNSLVCSENLSLDSESKESSPDAQPLQP